ncbi:cytochrome c assembly protein [Thermincola ferriacetica]|uniref:Cytochrome c assembly protein n=2 Tax=Thermincola TaxID=278993 RepID=D5X9Z2_THEPJ|nr:MULTISPECIES: heme lyase CcmF/NrfE family subunit [Thermincola]ADG83125.1 cytochrome c assembly protein [Thermincola potens JR]KNZ70613.1 cytochrome c assembly protein [Thermincola ferriacetica]
MIADLGYLSLMLAFGLSLYVIIANAVAIKTDNERLKTSAKGAVYGIALLTTIASLALLYSLAVSDFSIKYVYSYTSTDLPLFYKLSAWWAGNEGSLLLWVWVLAIYAAIVVRADKLKEMTPWVAIIMMINAAFFLFMMAFVTNPFEKLAFAPAEGQGLNPMLQNPGMVIHPVTTYLGYVGFLIPFAFSMAGLILKTTDDAWIKVTRRWTVIAWLFLTIGNLSGGQWAYVELGWGGYWAWDPVENASFMPWLTGSAFLHSVMIQERKNMLKIWNILLIIITYVLTLFGTFLVRSGILTSVHAFGNSDLGKFFLAFTVSALVASLWLMVDRLHMLKEEKQFESYISKESSFLFNNLVLLGITFATFWGTVFPILSEAVTGKKITVSIPFFNAVNAPLGLALFLLMGICPLIAWRKASMANLMKNFLVPVGATAVFALISIIMGMKPMAVLAFSIAFFALAATIYDTVKGIIARRKLTGEAMPVAAGKLLIRNRRRYGGYIIHIGLILILIGIIGSHTYDVQVPKSLKLGESVKVQEYNIKYDRLAERKVGKNDEVYAQLEVWKGDKYLGIMEPSRIFYPTHPNPSTEVAIHSGYDEDLYLILADWDQQGTSTFKILINPLVKWMWIGGWVTVFGTIFALWPGRGSAVGGKYIQRS